MKRLHRCVAFLGTAMLVGLFGLTASATASNFHAYTGKATNTGVVKTRVRSATQVLRQRVQETPTDQGCQ